VISPSACSHLIERIIASYEIDSWLSICNSSNISPYIITSSTSSSSSVSGGGDVAVNESLGRPLAEDNLQR
jgi:hypothetical protein